jgi:hypothetical protein
MYYIYLYTYIYTPMLSPFHPPLCLISVTSVKARFPQEFGSFVKCLDHNDYRYLYTYKTHTLTL